VHRLVQAVVRQQLPPDRQQATAERAVALLAAACPGDPVNPAGWAGYAALAPHVLAAGPLADQHPAGRQLMLDTIRYLEAKGDGSGSRAVGAPLLDRWRAILGSDHPDTLTAASRLASALAGLDAEAAHDLGEDTLQRCRRVLGPDHATSPWAAAFLTAALGALGEAEGARALGEDTLERCRRRFGLDHPITLSLARATGISPHARCRCTRGPPQGVGKVRYVLLDLR
jgi:hypothetical protein